MFTLTTHVLLCAVCRMLYLMYYYYYYYYYYTHALYNRGGRGSTGRLTVYLDEEDLAAIGRLDGQLGSL